jgi:ribosomal protein S19
MGSNHMKKHQIVANTIAGKKRVRKEKEGFLHHVRSHERRLYLVPDFVDDVTTCQVLRTKQSFTTTS